VLAARVRREATRSVNPEDDPGHFARTDVEGFRDRTLCDQYTGRIRRAPPRASSSIPKGPRASTASRSRAQRPRGARRDVRCRREPLSGSPASQHSAMRATRESGAPLATTFSAIDDGPSTRDDLSTEPRNGKCCSTSDHCSLLCSSERRSPRNPVAHRPARAIHRRKQSTPARVARRVMLAVSPSAITPWKARAGRARTVMVHSPAHQRARPQAHLPAEAF
jgi:hypothetical protein